MKNSDLISIIEEFKYRFDDKRVVIGDDIDSKLLEKVKSSYVKTEKDILLIVATAFFGSAKVGMAITEDGVYSKTISSSKPIFIPFVEIKEISLEKNRITKSDVDLKINGEEFFTFLYTKDESAGLVFELIKKVVGINNPAEKISDNHCNSCNSNYSLESDVCPYCGSKEQSYCEYCHTALLDGARFCSQCGSAVSSSNSRVDEQESSDEPTTAIGFKMNIDAKLLVTPNEYSGDIGECHLYLKCIDFLETNGIYSISLSRPAKPNYLLAETWEDELSFNYSKQIDGTVTIDVSGFVLFEPVNQIDGDLGEEDVLWSKLIYEDNDISMIEIEARISGDSNPTDLGAFDLISGSISHFANYWLNQDGDWEEDYD